jgi:uncharacterized protein
MTALFADTFYWVALANFADSAHQRALALTAQLGASHIATTDEVLTEYLTFFSDAPGPLRREAGRKRGHPDALTNDRHFEQEGFRALFRDP